MRVCVVGVWHLGTVIAGCLASAGHDVVAFDFDEAAIERLRRGEAPVQEPGLDLRGVRFSNQPADVASAAAIWIAYDTPVDDDDRADVEFVVQRIESLLPHVSEDALVVISSQLPAGTTRRIEEKAGARKRVSFVYSPENLRLGSAVKAFMQPDRVVAGARDEEARRKFADLMAPVTSRIEWMSIESAEMTKHALNAFLATSITFMNEIATICEKAGADANDVERGLKTDARIGPRAYLSPGAAFSGGTLARDIAFLADLGGNPPLIASVKTSNDLHRQWPIRKLRETLGDLSTRTIAVWGLTYKPGTNTLRRSESVEMCRALRTEGAAVRAFDPAIKTADAAAIGHATLCQSAEEAVLGADALVVATPWPEFNNATLPSGLIVIDAFRVITAPDIRHYSVGTPR